MVQVRLDDFYDVKDLALEMGATVKYADGRKFNTAGVQATRQPKPRAAEPKVAAPAPVPSPAPPPPAADNSALLQQLIAALNRPINVAVPEMAPPQVTVQAASPANPTAWTFDFERNQNGTIKRILAKPSKEQ